MNNIIIIITFIILSFSTSSFSQEVILNEEPSISALMEKFIEWNAEKEFINGWRIQVINTDDRLQMERTLSSFKSKFPWVGHVTWEQVSPYYKIKAGAFSSKIKAQALLTEIREYFPSAITVYEKIKESEILEKPY